MTSASQSCLESELSQILCRAIRPDLKPRQDYCGVWGSAARSFCPRKCQLVPPGPRRAAPTCLTCPGVPRRAAAPRAWNFSARRLAPPEEATSGTDTEAHRPKLHRVASAPPSGWKQPCEGKGKHASSERRRGRESGAASSHRVNRDARRVGRSKCLPFTGYSAPRRHEHVRTPPETPYREGNGQEPLSRTGKLRLREGK